MGRQFLLQHLSRILPITQLFPEYFAPSVCFHRRTIDVDGHAGLAAWNAHYSPVRHQDLSVPGSLLSDPFPDHLFLLNIEVADRPFARYMFRYRNGFLVRRYGKSTSTALPSSNRTH